jgi:hypothetical protein
LDQDRYVVDMSSTSSGSAAGRLAPRSDDELATSADTSERKLIPGRLLWAGRPAPARPHQFIDGDIQCDDEVIEDGAHKALSLEVDAVGVTPILGGLLIHLPPATTQPTSVI